MSLLSGTSLPAGFLISDFLFGCQPSCWEGMFSMSLLCGASLPVGLLISCLGVSLPVGKTFS